MRLIDAEPLDCLAWKDGEHGTTFDDGVLWVQEKIAEQPTIEPQQTCEYWDSESKFCALCRPSVQPQRTGKWIGYNTEQDGWKRTDGSPVFMSCSECNGLVLNNGSAHWNYCPNCGAKMEDGA